MQPNSSSAYLIIRQGNRWSDVFRLEKGGSLVVGRASSNAIPVADERASRKHAEIHYQDNQWWVRDLESRNGTWVDGKRIEGPCPLVPGNQIVVASCLMTFVHSLEEFIPPPGGHADVPAGASISNTQSDPAPAITHRKSNASMLESRAMDPEHFTALASTAATKDSKPTAEPVSVALLPLAFEIAQQTSITGACELALSQLMQTIGCRSGGILGIEIDSPSVSVDPRSVDHISEEAANFAMKIHAARVVEGRSYHPPSDHLIATIVRDPSAILARNVADDTNLLRRGKEETSHVVSTTSIIAAPIRIDKKPIGLIHLYSRQGEPDLTPDDLEVTLAIAEILAVSIGNLMRAQSLESKLRNSKERIHELEQQLGHVDWMVHSASMKRVRDQLARVAPTSATVLIRGESGTGKELVARAIHDASPRVSGPFIALNCAALSPTLLESELFGHEKGAFTGATERKLGKFELAHTGTLMLDELGEMSLEIQAKFLRVLESRTFERVGGNKPIHVDVRVIAATNRDLEKGVQEGSFRSDLYFRLRVIELTIPPLRDRTDDILPLATFFLQQLRQRSGHGPSGFSPLAQAAMLEHRWPGNVRELKNAVERAHVLATGPVAEPDDLALSHVQVPGIPSHLLPPTPVYRERTLDDLEREHIEATLQHTGGQKNRAASILGIERSTLDRKLKRFAEDSTPKSAQPSSLPNPPSST
jgi:DNA-binding NtrC family response regulator